MSMLRTMGGDLGITNFKIIHNSAGDQTVTEVDALVQAESGLFDVDTPIYDGDIVEVSDPRGGPEGTERRLVQHVKVNNIGPPDMRHIRVQWVVHQRRGSHPFADCRSRTSTATSRTPAGGVFADGHYDSAVSEAFKSIEVRVRQVSGVEKSGAKLMGDVFQIDSPKIDVAVETGQSGRDEREGFLALFRGAMIGIRNPRAHELFQPDDPQRALEYLGFASLLHRRIDAALQTESADRVRPDE